MAYLRKAVYFFNYSVHDERWHSFAIAVSHQDVSMFVECGKKYFLAERDWMLTQIQNSMVTLKYELTSSFWRSSMSVGYYSFCRSICNHWADMWNSSVAWESLLIQLLYQLRYQKILSCPKDCENAQDTLLENKSVLRFHNNDSVAVE